MAGICFVFHPFRRPPQHTVEDTDFPLLVFVGPQDFDCQFILAFQSVLHPLELPRLAYYYEVISMYVRP